MKQALLALACLALAAPLSISAQSSACAPSNGLNFICGLQKPEDLVLIPGTGWLIASGMDPGAGLHLIDTRAKRAQPLYASDTPARPDRNRFANCPDPLDPRQAVLHGLSLRPAQAGHYTLYATNHGGRESIEAFDIDGRGATPSATWVGCVLMPDKLAANSVAAFGDGALVSTAAGMETPAGFANHGAFVSCVAHMKDMTLATIDWTKITPESCAAAKASDNAKADAAKAKAHAGKAKGLAKRAAAANH